MDLSTDYMGLVLRNPLVASASPLSRTADAVRRLADAGVGAVVLYSLFEEQVLRESAENARLVDAGAEIFAESLTYFPESVEEEPGPRQYLSLLERAHITGTVGADVQLLGAAALHTAAGLVTAADLDFTPSALVQVCQHTIHADIQPRGRAGAARAGWRA